MRKLKSIILAMLAVSLCWALCACGGIGNTPKGESGIYVMVAAYKNNALVDGKLLVTAQNEYALIPYGEEIKAENVVRLTYAADISSLVGVPASYEIEDGTITNVFQEGKETEYSSYRLRYEDGKLYLPDDTEILIADTLKSNPEKHFLVLDGLHFASGDIDGSFGFNMYNDDILTLHDVDNDGVYDYIVYTPVYNGLTVEKVDGNDITLKGGYGSAAWLDIFGEGSNTTLRFKKGLGQNGYAVGDILNIKVRLDSSLEVAEGALPVFMEFVSNTKTDTGYLNASIWNSETDIMSRLDGYVQYWTRSVTDNDANSGRSLVKADALGNVFEFMYDDSGRIIFAEEGDVADINHSELSGLTTLETENGTQAAALLDVQSRWHSNNTYSGLSAEISMLYNIGIRRVYVVICNPGYPMFSFAQVGYSSRSMMKATTNTFRYLGFESPDHAIAKICHDKGMECYAVYKNYEGGGMSTAPLGGKMEEDMFYEVDRFGHRYSFEDYIEEMLQSGKDYRIIRRPDGANDNLDGTVDKITVDFVAGSYEYRNNNGRRTETYTVSALTQAQIDVIANGRTYTKENQHRPYSISLWTSPDNYQYTLYEGDYSYRYVLSNKVLYDVNGDAMFDGKAMKTITLEITGLKIEDYFCAITFADTANLRTDPFSQIHLWSGDREIVTTSTDFVRNPGETELANPDPENYVWGRDLAAARSSYCTSLKLDRDGNLVKGAQRGNTSHADRSYLAIDKFPYYGFEFNFEPYPGEIRTYNCVIAVGRGRIESFPGGLCEGYEEVRSYWLSNVERALKGGFDGVVIRLQAHSSIATDVKNYGYNEPIMDKYKELYGQSAYNLLMDPAHTVTDEEYIRIMKIRGDYLMLFLEDAADMCHRYGAEFAVTLREAHIDPEVSRHQNELTWWTMPKVALDWQKVVDLCDFVVIKDYIFNNEYVQTNAQEIRKYAHEQGKEVWIEAYDDQAGNFNRGFFIAADNDKYTDGIILYELSEIVRYSSGDLKKLLEQSGFEVTYHGE